jgi:6-phosphogluconolactonase (cycloisomerase 2 family)
MYTINASTGVLAPTNPASVPGGAFDVTVDPSSRFVYVPDNVTNFVSSFTIDSTTGVLTPTSQGALQAGMEPTNVAVDPSSKFAYVVNRQGNSISAYSIDHTTGALSLIGTAPTGQQPWRARVDPSGKFVYVGNETGSVSIYSINSDGMLTAAGSSSTPAGAFDISIISHK